MSLMHRRADDRRMTQDGVSGMPDAMLERMDR
jgi:hypothetical protein